LVLVVVLVGSGAAASAETADAFVGENLVINPVTKEITGPAKTIITNPTFLPEVASESSSFGAAKEASGAARTLQAGKVLPSIGAAVGAFAAGWEVGAEICGLLGISGCFHLFGSGSGPDDDGGIGFPTRGRWEYKTVEFETVPAYSWIWGFGKPGGGGYAANVEEVSGVKCPGWTAPGDVSYWITRGPMSCNNAGVTEYGSNVTGVRYAMKDLSLQHNASDDPGVPNYPYTAGADWPKALAQAMTATPEGERVGEKVASKIGGSEVQNPYALMVEVPNCDGLVYAACEELLEERGLNPTRVKRGWSEADIDKDPDEVLELDPARSTEVEKGTVVTVTTNPDEEGMPIVVPQPEPGETYDDYAARLNPGLSPERKDLEAAYVDPAAGPNGVVDVTPQPQTKLNPGTSPHKVTVKTNPPDAPPASGGWNPPSIRGINMAPLLEGDTPCNSFPFGLFCWVGEALAQFDSAGVCPHFAAPVADTGADFEMTMCGETAETIMGYLRPAILLAFVVGCGYMFARGTKAVEAD
jgi:beta-lactam-binding protein with PASTA domain